MSGNLLDYLKPVDEAGDKSYKNGKQEFSAEDEKKANDLIKQIAYQKQLDLERGNTEAILAKLKENTPEAAIYRALLLQQIEQYQKEKKEGKKDGDEKKDDKKDDKEEGILKKSFNWLKSTSWTVTKTLAIAALIFLAKEGVNNYRTIKDKGWKAAWENVVANQGVAKSPEFAEQTGESTAALNGDVVKRNVKFDDLNDAEKAVTMNFAKDHMDKGATFDTTEAEFKLVPFFKKGKEYDLKLPEGANPADYTKGYTMILNTGGKDGTTIPVSPSTIGQNAYDSMFKISNLRTEITPQDSWFTGNQHLRAIDNGAWGLNSYYNYIFGDPESKKLKMPFENDITSDMYPSSKRPKLDLPEPKPLSSSDVLAKVVTDKSAKIKANQDILNRNIVFNSQVIGVRFRPDPRTLEKTMDELGNGGMNVTKANKVFSALNPGTGYGIDKRHMKNFWKDVIKIRETVKDPNERKFLYNDVIRKHSTTRFFRIPGLYNKPYIEPNFINERQSALADATESTWFKAPAVTGTLAALGTAGYYGAKALGSLWG